MATSVRPRRAVKAVAQRAAASTANTKRSETEQTSSASSQTLATPRESVIVAPNSALTTPKRGKRGSKIGVPDEEKLSTTVTPKKRKVTAATSNPNPSPPRDLIPLSGAPELLPGVLSFSLPTAISHLSAVDPRFAKLYDAVPLKPFAPPLEPIDPFRTLVTSIIGQQVSWMAARAITGRFRALFGYEGDDGFPTPGQVAAEDLMRLKGVGLSMRKAEYVKSLAEHFASGELSTRLLKDGSDEEIAKALIAVRGIGQWTVDMFLIFSLRRPDVLPVGDLGVQKGLLRWALAAHDALPRKEKKEGKKAAATKAKYSKPAVKSEVADSHTVRTELRTLIKTPPPDDRCGVPMTPITPASLAGEPNDRIKPVHLVTPVAPKRSVRSHIPPTPITPAALVSRADVVADVMTQQADKPQEMLEVPGEDLPTPAPDDLMTPPLEDPRWDKAKAAPLTGGLSVELMRSRLAGKKAKGGAYLTPSEMEILTDAWKPYRSLGVYYMWPAGEEF